MPAWWPRQDLSTSPTHILMVGVVPIASSEDEDTRPLTILDSPSRVPKELISRFVKICPTCQVRRGGSRLTPPNSRRGSPRLEMVPRSPKLPSPPIIKRESSYGAHPSLDRTHPEYLGQFHGHNGWIDSSQSIHGRSALNSGIRSYPGPMNGLSHSMAGGIDPFSADLSVPPSQLSYTTGYVPSHGAPAQRDF